MTYYRDGDSIIHINEGVNVRYRGVVRLPGRRNWIFAGPWRKSRKRAADEMYRKFINGVHYKRAAVWMAADYYDPIPIVEMQR
jgi:hypothetical protein